MYIGQYIVKIDKQHRVALPKAFLKEDISCFMMNRNTNHSLVLQSKEAWENTCRIIGQLDREKKTNLEFVRLFYQGVEQLDIDSNGRINLPSRLLDSINGCKELLFNGLLNRIELWNPEIYKAQADNIAKPTDFLYPVNELSMNDPEDIRQLINYLRLAYKTSIL